MRINFWHNLNFEKLQLSSKSDVDIARDSLIYNIANCAFSCNKKLCRLMPVLESVNLTAAFCAHRDWLSAVRWKRLDYK